MSLPPLAVAAASLGFQVKSWQVSNIWTYMTLETASIEVAGQLRPPPECGHRCWTVLAFGVSSGLMVLRPVLGTMPTTRFWMPRSREKAYLPVARSTASNRAILPPVTTRLAGLPFTGTVTRACSNTQSRSHTSRFTCWKCQASLPVTGSRATVESVYRPSLDLPFSACGSSRVAVS